MPKISKIVFLFVALFSAAQFISSEQAAKIKRNNMQKLKEIYVAGGCFWGLEGYFKKVRGVVQTEVGYANGTSDKTDYYSLKKTDHAETLKLMFDENVVAFAEILAHFFRVIDPTSLNKQGNDAGRQYRTGIYYTDARDKKFIEDFVAIEQKKYAKKNCRRSCCACKLCQSRIVSSKLSWKKSRRLLPHRFAFGRKTAVRRKQIQRAKQTRIAHDAERHTIRCNTRKSDRATIF